MFHVTPDGETSPLDEFSKGYVVGILVGEGHFGGDGKQPPVTLRMHTRHEKLFRWLERAFPSSKLYGPYHHGGRHYFQWMARGECLRQDIVPLIAERLEWLDDHVQERFLAMCTRYGLAVSESVSGEDA